jgi:predicted metal-dependent phosphoesterase TrpH
MITKQILWSKDAMIIDMHVHSQASDDAGASVEAYLRWVQNLRKSYQIDGLVLTEHRMYQIEDQYEALAEEFNILILKGAEVETNYGHFLLYGIGDEVLSHFDFRRTDLNANALMEKVAATGGIMVPAHPGRETVGFCSYLDQFGEDLREIKVIEQLNGANKPSENIKAIELAKQRNYFSIGGSDAHYVSSLGACLTRFKNSIANTSQLVAELYKGDYWPIYLEEAKIIK